jgi:hypothetical protein
MFSFAKIIWEITPSIVPFIGSLLVALIAVRYSQNLSEKRAYK